MKRYIEAKLIEDTGGYHYILTEEGRKKALEEVVLEDITSEFETGDQAIATTEYKQFERLGALSGCTPAALIKQTANYVFEGGDYKDMKWVAQAMQELGIQTDVRGRWWHCWRGKMRQAIPSDLPAEFLSGESKTGEKKEKKGKRDYILNENDNPTYVGEGLGDLDHDEAFELAKIKAGAAVRRRDASPPSASSQIDDVIKIVNLVKSTEGEKAAGKSYIVKPGEDGAFQVEEAVPGKPIVVSQQGPATKPSVTYYADSEGTVKELQPGQPLVIIKEAPKQVATSGTHYLVDQKTGEVKEVAPGQPIVIIRESAQSQSTPIQVKDKDGNPMVLDLSTFIKLEEHRDKQRRDEESHETKMEIAKSFKDLLHKAGSALSHMAEGEEK